MNGNPGISRQQHNHARTTTTATSSKNNPHHKNNNISLHYQMQNLENSMLPTLPVSLNSDDPLLGSSSPMAAPTSHEYRIDLKELPPKHNLQWVYNPSDGSVLRDPSNGRPITVDRILATKPLRHELSTRPGPGNKKLTYISGDGVARTLNDIFGYDGWNLDITKVNREECIQDTKTGKYSVVYTAMVRLTHKASGSYREDCGTGDSTDKQFAIAVDHAIKGSITDAMKRAARHFGDKLGNSLYESGFSVNKAPTTLKEALDRYDIERANTKFGFPKDQPNYKKEDRKTTTGTTSHVKNVVAPVAPPAVGGKGSDHTRSSVPDHHASSSSTSSSSGPIHPTGWQRNTIHPNVNLDQKLPSVQGPSPVVQPTRPINGSYSTERPIPPQATSTRSSHPQATITSTNPRSFHPPERKPVTTMVAAPPEAVPSIGQEVPAAKVSDSTTDSSTTPATPHINSSVTPTTNTTTIMMPPPTPMDSLRNSAIFSFSDVYDEDDYQPSSTTATANTATATETTILPTRPRSSYGRPSRPPSLGGDENRPITTQQVPPPPLPVAPIPQQQQQHPTHPTTHNLNNKRPVLQSVGNMDPSSHQPPAKKSVVTSATTGTSTTMILPANPYGKVHRG